MSTETNITPEVDQPATATKSEKKERNYNGIYRRNNRMRKAETDKEKTKTLETVTDNASNVVSEKTHPKFEVKVKNRSRKTSLIVNEESTQPKTTTKKISKKKVTEEISETTEVVETTQAEVEEISETTEVEETTQAESLVSVRRAFHELLYLIRQKNAYNHNEFFLELEKVLEVMPFTAIKESKLSLFGFACMYDREIIFQKLCQDYAQFIEQEDLESVMKICFTKREETVGNLIKVYAEHFKPESEFIKELFTAMSISSYREKNNIQILEWIAPYLTEVEYEVFWNKCIEYRNVSLINTAMHVPSMKDNLQKNLEKYIDGFKLIGREHTIQMALNREYRKITVNPISNAPLPTIRKSYLADNVKQLKSIQQDEDEGAKQPVVVFKTVRKSTES